MSYDCFHTCRLKVSFVFLKWISRIFYKQLNSDLRGSLSYLAHGVQISFYKVKNGMITFSLVMTDKRIRYLIEFELSVILGFVFWLLQDFFVDLFADYHLPIGTNPISDKSGQKYLKHCMLKNWAVKIFVLNI